MYRRRKKRENWLIYLAKTDLMTGLCNRGSGEKRLLNFLKKKTGGLLCLIDCDKFKSINDNYGHSVGDKGDYSRCEDAAENMS